MVSSAAFCLGLLAKCLGVLLLATCTLQGGCEFPPHWSGSWFQSGVQSPIHINLTYIETKGECYEANGDKFLVHDRGEDCYRCMAIHDKHKSVLQYKETYCDKKASLTEICYDITGDAALYSMFKKYPEAKPVPCPFKSAPFTFSYNRGSGDCANPPSKAESCTDDSRLVLKYQACPDVQSTESNVEELVCLATWKEGSTRYLIGKVSQGNRLTLTSDEDQYRCFIYERSSHGGRVVYHVAQSGDATCNGLQNAFEGSRTMKLTTVDNHHNRCKFPAWLTEHHHTWLSLDHRKTYKFSQRNATLKIMDDGSHSIPIRDNQNYGFGLMSEDQRKPVNTEMRVICHSILQAQEQKKVQIVAHITHGCDSGYVCMVFYKRDSNVIEIQQSKIYEENPDDACRNFDPTTIPYTTLITPTLHSKKCPHLGRYTLVNPSAIMERRKRRQQVGIDSLGSSTPAECLSHDYEALAVGCSGSPELMEFKSSCLHQPISEYSCHGSWQENGTHYVITSPVARKSTDALRYCFIYNLSGGVVQSGVALMESVITRSVAGPTTLRLSSFSDSCHRHITPGVEGAWSFNFTSNGTCAEADSTNMSPALLLSSASLCVLSVICSVLTLR